MLGLLLTAACSNAPQNLAWTRIDLPADGPVVLSDVTDCGGQWWAVGAVMTADGTTTRPAAWTGQPFREVTFVPLATSYYGPRQVIRSVACAGDTVVMVGATPGGAHGNPRVSTWHRRPDGRMAENAAPFETYGGDEAVDVGPIAAGPAGFAIAGNRTSGAAAWFSADGRTFTLTELGATGTVARDVTLRPDGGWLVVGGAVTTSTGGEQGAMGWTADAKGWSPGERAADGPGFSEIQRAVRDGDDVLAAGVSGTGAMVWRRHDSTWTAAETLAGAPPGVLSLAVADGRSVVVTGPSAGGLWIAGERRQAPADPVAVAARGATVLLATHDSLWQTTVPR